MNKDQIISEIKLNALHYQEHDPFMTYGEALILAIEDYGFDVYKSHLLGNPDFDPSMNDLNDDKFLEKVIG